MADGSKKLLKAIKQGDEVLTVDLLTNKIIAVKVQALTEHEAKKYAFITLLLVNVKETITQEGTAVQLTSKALQVTPNHPVQTSSSIKEAGKIVVGDKLFCMNDATKNN